MAVTEWIRNRPRRIRATIVIAASRPIPLAVAPTVVKNTTNGKQANIRTGCGANSARHIRSHSTVIPIEINATRAAKAAPPIQMHPSATGTMTTVERSRVRRSTQRAERSAGVRTCSGSSAWASAKSAVPSGVVSERSGKMGLVKVGPQHVEEDQFRVCGLPKQKVRQTLLPRGPND